MSSHDNRKLFACRCSRLVSQRPVNDNKKPRTADELEEEETSRKTKCKKFLSPPLLCDIPGGWGG